VIGKTGDAYLLNADDMGGIGHPLYAQEMKAESYGGLAYAKGLIYVPFRTIGVVALRLADASTSVGWQTAPFQAGPPIVAANAVWVMDLRLHNLYAFDRATGRLRFSEPIPEPAHFATPTASGKQLYIAAGTQLLTYAEH
jgi:outer membrane protein assembly factor BamB